VKVTEGTPKSLRENRTSCGDRRGDRLIWKGRQNKKKRLIGKKWLNTKTPIKSESRPLQPAFSCENDPVNYT
jgi:hypothetical protein